MSAKSSACACPCCTPPSRIPQFKDWLNSTDGVTLLLIAEAAGSIDAAVAAIATYLGHSPTTEAMQSGDGRLTLQERTAFNAAITQKLIDLRPLAKQNFYNWSY